MGNLSLNVLTFPLWWYTTGISLVWNWAVRQYRFNLHRTGLLLFVRHIKEPLYGDYTKTGIVLGFFLRLVLLVFKLIAFCLRTVVLMVILLLYLAILPLSLTMICYQLLPL